MGLVLPGVAGMAACSAAAGFWARSFGSAAIALGLLGVFGGLYLIPQTSIFQARSPHDRRGAYLAVQNFSNYGFMLLASLLYALLKKLGLESGQIFLVVAAGLVAVGVTQTALQPSLILGNAWQLLRGGAGPARGEAA